MSTPHRFAALALAALTAAATAACSKGSTSTEEAAPRIPASSDPAGKDIVEGAVIAAHETKLGGIRLYKVTHVDDYPDPIGYEYHMIAYDPKCDTFEKCALVWKKHETKINFEHLVVREVHFLPRDHRVLFVEPLTEAERATYTRSRDSRGAPPAPPPQ